MALGPDEVANLLAKHSQQEKTDRATASFHISVDLVKRFKKICGDANARVLEDLIEQFCVAAEKVEVEKQKSPPTTEITIEK